MAQLVLLVVVMTVAGYVLRRFAIVSEHAATDVTRIVFGITLPALVFTVLHRAALTWSLALLPLVAWGMTLAGLGLGLLGARALRLDRPRTGAFVLAMVFGNTTFLGYPIIQGFFGSGHLTLAIFYDLLGATIAGNTLGIVLGSATGEGKGSVRAVVRRLATLPPLWALAAGLALHGVRMPAIVLRLLEQVGSLTSPLILLTIGLSLKLGAWREDLGGVAVAAAGRLLVLPALVFAVVKVAGLPRAVQQVAVLQAAMPTMFYALTLALFFRLRKELVINAIVVSTLASALTLPAWRYLVGR